MKTLNLLLFVFGPIDIVFPVLGVFLGLALLCYIIALIGNSISNKKTLENAEVVYPENFLNNVELMKKNRNLIFYSERVEKYLFVITTSNISEKYENGKFIIYGEQTSEVKAIRESLKSFLSKFPEIDVKSILVRGVGGKARVELVNKDEAPVNHYSAIGFTVRNTQDVKKIYDDFNRRQQDVEIKHVNDINLGKCVYKKYSVGDIRYVVKYTEKDRMIRNLSIGHDNKNVTVVDKNLKSFAQEEKDIDFPLVKVEKDGQPFWFSCLNLDEALLFEKKENMKLKISSFVNNLEIKDQNNVNSNLDNGVNINNGELSFADECYVNVKGGAKAYIQGIIKDFNLKINIITNQKYWAIDIVCLGYNIKVLADYRLINAENLVVGKVLAAEMWNTAFFVNE